MTFHWPWGRPWCAQRLWGPGPWLSLEHRLDRGHGGGQSLASGQLLGGALLGPLGLPFLVPYKLGRVCWSQVPGLLRGTDAQSLLPSVGKVTYAQTRGAGQHELGRPVGPTALTGPQVVGWVFSFFPRCPHSACWGSANTCIPGVHQGWGSKWGIELTLKTDRGRERNFTLAT